ncbi:gamma-glutamyltransferase [Rhodococcus pyridinivorans]|uniref:gamma-glutamyltransferase n=1 Tax=Rhodococcus pyridinivorans TaxID=103816 RepID=UPI000E714989|nr:gamma-glutamyltransferase [Rhodococcus pyridinivorans]WAL45322.1 gamma-glutamyltransferase [Rhodococcus pyridinivorans]
MVLPSRVRSGVRAAFAAAVSITLLGACTSASGDTEAGDMESGGTADVQETAAAATCTAEPNGTPITDTQPATETGDRDISTNPEIATGYRAGMTAVTTSSFAVSTANPASTEAACEVLRDGGTAADALVAAQMVLGLVEPQSSGIGGGAFLVYYDAESGEVKAYDGRETAPMSATENYLRWISDTDRTEPRPDARASGRSIGVPGVVRMLETVHAEHGSAAWGELFRPAIDLADQGIVISDRLAQSIADSAEQLAVDDEARAYFLQADGSPKPEGEILTNPAMSKTLSAIATDGADAFYTGDIAAGIVESTGTDSGGRTPGTMTLEDLAVYEAKERQPLCTSYREYEICGMPNPSSGGMAVAATLGILENFDLASLPPSDVDADGGVPDADAVHLISEAERLAYADRDKYVADADFVPLPGGSLETLVNPDYLSERAGLIDPGKSMGKAQPGDFGPVPLGMPPQSPEHGTSHISVADSYGNVASMTTTIESAFGSFHMTDGFLLNNQLTDFSAEPVDEDGLPVANRVEPGKRPRSSMAPTLVFDRTPDGGRGDIRMVVGSPGGSVIIQFVVKTLVNTLDWGLDPQQAVSAVSFGAANTPVTGVGGEHPAIDGADDGANDPLVQQLRDMGHEVSVAPQSSGLSALLRQGEGWVGGADPRREGAVMGDTGGQ